MPRKKSSYTTGSSTETADYRHSGQKRKNIPPAKIAAEGVVPKVEKVKYAYDPHLPPVLRFDPTGDADRIADLIAEAGRRPLTAAEQSELREATSHYDPWLEWAGKREEHERGFFEVDPVALHIHERISAQAIVRTAMRQDAQRGLFADPEQPYHEAVQFYRHDVDWANRMILGDSLQVMSSLATREGLAGKVQMIYMDPPYGIKFSSNFQPSLRSRTVREADSDLSREAETVRAFRDTWTTGTHSYLSYMRDRLALARDLLSESGSLFVQIGAGNVQYVRTLLDEVFGVEKFAAQINFKSKSALGASELPLVYDYILWYVKDPTSRKFRELFRARNIAGDREWRFLAGSGGQVKRLGEEEFRELSDYQQVFRRYKLTSSGFTKSCTYGFPFQGVLCRPYGGKSWATNNEGMQRLVLSERLFALGGYPNFKQYYSDFPVMKYDNNWSDQPAAQARAFVVETPAKFIERCLLMATDPGDLVLDPTCGSGTTAYVAETWGRRWITIDTSRVAVAIARQRLLTSKFDHYRTTGGSEDHHENPATGFVYRPVPHITLKAIAQNTNLDPVFKKHEPILEERLAACNEAQAGVSENLRERLAAKLRDKEKTEGKRAVTDADRRRWLLPPENRDRSAKARKAATVDLDAPTWYDWEAPFDTDPDWPQELQDAVTTYSEAWRAKMGEMNACIAANADQEKLVDQPEVVKGVLRVSGPFTVEGVRPEELSLGEEGLFDGTPDTLEASVGEDAEAVVEEVADEAHADLQNASAYLSRMVRLLRQDGVTFPDNQHRDFTSVEALFDSPDSGGGLIHAEGEWAGDDGAASARVGIGFGPQYGPVTALQAEELVRAAARRYDELVIAGFSFDAEASAVIHEAIHPSLRIHQAYIRPDVNPGMDGLLKDTPNSQLFTVFGQPEIAVRPEGDEWVCELLGVDIYDPLTATVKSTGASKVAAWFLDQDYDGRCFCITQAFFPDQKAWDKIAKALGSSADPEAFAAFEGTVSLPFVAGKHRRIAVKVIDPRGNEVMAIRTLEG